jgi:hypothetical protein
MDIKTGFFEVIWLKKIVDTFSDWSRIHPTKVGHFQKSSHQKMKFDNNEICFIFPIDSLVLYVGDHFDFLRKTD